MSDEKKPASQSLDLSTGKRGKSKKTLKGVAPLVQKTINLSTPKEEKEAKAEKPSVPKHSKKSNRKSKPNKKKLRSSGSSLADLLDPETLAKLRGK